MLLSPMPLVNVPCPTSFEHLRTVNETLHDTYRSACQALNLLDTDQHWDNCINDACNMSTLNQICELFAIILITCSPSTPTELSEKHKSQIRSKRSDMTMDFKAEIYNCTFVMIEDLSLCLANKPIKHFGMPSPNRTAALFACVELDREQS